MPDKTNLPDDTLGQLAESITASVMRAVAARDEVQRFLQHNDAVIAWRPEVTAGGWIVLARGGAGAVLPNVGPTGKIG